MTLPKRAPTFGTVPGGRGATTPSHLVGHCRGSPIGPRIPRGRLQSPEQKIPHADRFQVRPWMDLLSILVLAIVKQAKRVDLAELQNIANDQNTLRLLLLSNDTYFHRVRRHLSSPCNGADPSRLEGEASEHGNPSLLAGLGFGRNNLGTQPAGPFNPGRNSRRF